MEPRLLAFDTATEVLALAVCGAGEPRTINQPGGALASTALLPAIQAMLAAAGLKLVDLDAIAFGRGPGAFTGLRTSCAAAQGLAFGSGRPVLPIDSLLIVAEDARGRCGGAAELDVAVAMDARMGEIYGARYRWLGQRWTTLQAPALYSVAAWRTLAASWSPALLAGSALALHDLAATLPAAIARPQEDDRAAALLRLAGQAWRDGHAVDAAQALPLYVRDQVALTTAERAAARRAREGAAT